MKQTYLKRLLFYILAAFTLGIGISFLIASQYGADALSTFAQGIVHTFRISQGLANWLIYGAMMLAVWVLAKQHLGWPSLIFSLVVSAGIDSGLTVLPFPDAAAVRWGMQGIGMLLMSGGIALSIHQGLGKGPYDAFLYMISDYSSWSYAGAKWLCDGLLLGIGVFLGGTLGWGTVLNLLVTGKLTEYFLKWLHHSERSYVQSEQLYQKTK